MIMTQLLISSFAHRIAREGAEITCPRGICCSITVVTCKYHYPKNKLPPLFCPMLACTKGRHNCGILWYIYTLVHVHVNVAYTHVYAHTHTYMHTVIYIASSSDPPTISMLRTHKHIHSLDPRPSDLCNFDTCTYTHTHFSSPGPPNFSTLFTLIQIYSLVIKPS